MRIDIQLARLILLKAEGGHEVDLSRFGDEVVPHEVRLYRHGLVEGEMYSPASGEWWRDTVEVRGLTKAGFFLLDKLRHDPEGGSSVSGAARVMLEGKPGRVRNFFVVRTCANK